MTNAFRPPAFLFVLLSVILLSGCASQKEPSAITGDVSFSRDLNATATRADERETQDEASAPMQAAAPNRQPASDRPDDSEGVDVTTTAPERRVDRGPTSTGRPPSVRQQEAPASGQAPDGADAFWTSFQRAIRSGDRAAIEAGIGGMVRVNDESFARDSEEVQGFIDSLVENDAVREATLAVGRLEHDSGFSMFEAKVGYVFNGQRQEVPLAGRIEEVRPGDWRLVEVTVGL